MFIPYAIADDNAHVECTQEYGQTLTTNIRSFEKLYYLSNYFILFVFSTIYHLVFNIFSFFLLVHYLKSFVNSSNYTTVAINMMFLIERCFLYYFFFPFLFFLFFSFFVSSSFNLYIIIYNIFLFILLFFYFTQRQ